MSLEEYESLGLNLGLGFEHVDQVAETETEPQPGAVSTPTVTEAEEEHPRNSDQLDLLPDCLSSVPNTPQLQTSEASITRPSSVGELEDQEQDDPISNSTLEDAVDADLENYFVTIGENSENSVDEEPELTGEIPPCDPADGADDVQPLNFEGQTITTHRGTTSEMCAQTKSAVCVMPAKGSKVVSSGKLQLTAKSAPRVAQFDVQRIHVVKVHPEQPAKTVIQKPQTRQLSRSNPVPQQENSYRAMGLTKGAEVARKNRQKKKQYVADLETSVVTLKDENKSLKKDVHSLTKTVRSLQDEVQYLQSVLANQSALSSLLKNIPLTTSVKFAPFSQSSAQECLDLDETADSHTRQETKTQVGVVPPMKRMHESEDEDDEQCDSKENLHQNSRRSGKSNIKKGSKRQQLDHDYATQIKPCKVVLSNLESASSSKIRPARRKYYASKSEDAGVCLHVANNLVSLEFCTACSKRAIGGKQC